MTRVATQATMQGPKLGDLVEHLSTFEGPPEQFLQHLLAVQCHLATADGGAIIRMGPQGKPEILAVHPAIASGGTAPPWLGQAVDKVAKAVEGGQTVVHGLRSQTDLYGVGPSQHLILAPLRGGGGTRGVAAFLITTSDPTALNVSRDRIELTLSLLALYEMRLTLQKRGVDLQRLRGAYEVLAAVNEHDRMAASAMAFCNQVASRWNAGRVSLGFLKGRYVKARAMSHTEKFSRKSKLVQDLEAAMEESVDQDVEVVHPAAPEATFVARATAEMSQRHGPATICTLPLRHRGKPVAAVTLERPVDQPFLLEEVETLRLACDLVTPRLVDLHDHDRWFGARAATATRKAVAVVLGPEHTWAKLTAVGVLVVLIFLALWPDMDTVEARATIQSVKRQMVASPFDGFLSKVDAVPGQHVDEGQELGALDTFEQDQAFQRALAKKAEYEGQAAIAERDGKIADMKVAQKQAEQAAVDAWLAQEQIKQATLKAPMAGIIVSDDQMRRVGERIKLGENLFEINPLDVLRAELLVPEDRIADVHVGSKGQLSTESHPGQKIQFEVERVNPVAEVVKQKNVFKVRVKLLLSPAELANLKFLRPGVEGDAKIDVEKRTLLANYTRSTVNFIRHKLWQWGFTG